MRDLKKKIWTKPNHDKYGMLSLKGSNDINFSTSFQDATTILETYKK